MMTKNVVVLMGGWSAEREVSLVSGAACVNALKSAGYAVTPIDVQRDMGALLTRLLPRPDVVFNALHGRYGEDGCVQGLLDMLGIAYTHSGLLASAMAMDKPLAKRLFAAAGIKVAEEAVLSREALLNEEPMPRPFVIKPINEGSSVGVHIVMDRDNEPLFGSTGWPFGEHVMVEKFIDGRELTVAVMGKGDDAKAMAVTEISTHRGFYDYEAKYEDGGSIHVVSEGIDDFLTDEAMRAAEIAHRTLGCRGISRSDFRHDGKDLYILETNTQPGMTPTSLVPEQAAEIGMSFEALVSWLVENAECDE
jgi:D-alanine-D-alanine ligase